MRAYLCSNLLVGQRRWCGRVRESRLLLEKRGHLPALLSGHSIQVTLVRPMTAQVAVTSFSDCNLLATFAYDAVAIRPLKAEQRSL